MDVISRYRVKYGNTTSHTNTQHTAMAEALATEAQRHIAKLTAEDVKGILSETVVVEDSSLMSSRMAGESKIDVCNYQCTPQGCDFEEVLMWVSKYQNILVAEMMNDDMKNATASAVCAHVNKNMDIIQPRKYEGYYFHHHNKPIMFMKNSEISHPTYTQQRRDVASIDVENLTFYSMKAMKKGAMNEYLGNMKITSSWQELAINTGAAVLGVLSVSMAVKKSKTPPIVSPLLLAGLSVGMFGLNRYGQEQQLKRKKQ